MMRSAILIVAILASPETHAKDWNIDRASGDTAASVLDSAGNEFGITCNDATKACFWVLKSRNPCRAGLEKLSIRARDEAHEVGAACVPADKSGPAVVVLTDFEQVRKIVTEGKSIQITSPDQEQLSTGVFDSSGSAQAIQSIAATQQ